MRRTLVLPVAGLAVLILVGAYLALGGATYKPLEVADPCEPRAAEVPASFDEQLERLALTALDGAACELRVTREELALALADPEQLEQFAAEHRITGEEVEQAAREGLLHAIDEAEGLGLLSGLELTLVRDAAERLPVGVVLDLLREADEAGLLELLGETEAGPLLDTLRGLERIPG